MSLSLFVHKKFMLYYQIVHFSLAHLWYSVFSQTANHITANSYVSSSPLFSLLTHKKPNAGSPVFGFLLALSVVYNEHKNDLADPL